MSNNAHRPNGARRINATSDFGTSEAFLPEAAAEETDQQEGCSFADADSVYLRHNGQLLQSLFVSLQSFDAQCTAHERRVRQLWGPQPPYVPCDEDTASLLATFTYTWIGDFIYRAANEQLNAESLPPPTQMARTYECGTAMSREVATQLRCRRRWDALRDGCLVVLKHQPACKSTAASKGTTNVMKERKGHATGMEHHHLGVLRWVGYLQRAKRSTELMAGVEWLGDFDDNASSPSGRLLHSGVVDGETLFECSRPNRATCEPTASLVLVLPTAAAWASAMPSLLSSRSAGGAEDAAEDDNHGRRNATTTASVLALIDKHHCDGHPPKHPSAFWALMHVHWRILLPQVPFKCVSDYMTLSSPIILEYLVEFLTDENPDVGMGVALVVIVFVFNVVQTVCSQRYYGMSIQSGLVVRGSFLGYIFEKCFTVSQKALTYPEMSTGRIINMVGTDVERANDFCWYAMYLWASPQLFFIAIGLLYRLVGWCAVAGLGAMVVTMPVQGWIAKRQQQLRIDLSRLTDQRVKITTELLSGMRIVKFMAWEQEFLERIQNVRRQELLMLKTIQLYRVLTSLLNVAAPTLVIATVLVLYHVSGHELTARIVFPTIALLNLMRMPFMMIPFVFTAFVQLFVAMGRVTKFFECEDENIAQVLDIETYSGRGDANEKGGPMDGDGAKPWLTLCDYAIIMEEMSVAAYIPAKLPPLLGGSSMDEEGHIRKLTRRIGASCECLRCRRKASSAAKERGEAPKCCQEDGEKRPLLGGEKHATTTTAATANEEKAAADGGSGGDKGDKMKKAPFKKGAANEDTFELHQKVLLEGVTLHIPKNRLTVIVGPTGSGKSTILDAILGSFDIVKGDVYAPIARGDQLAYVPQQAWIMNATLKENILFFSEYDEEWFQKTIQTCELEADIEAFMRGVDTEIGEKGVTLSGGQRARVGLARAVYARREVYLLDDPLSALDAHVSRAIMDGCICTTLQGTTRVLCTHQTHVLAQADHVVVLNDAHKLCYEGPYEGYLVHPTAAREMSSSPTMTGSNARTASFRNHPGEGGADDDHREGKRDGKSTTADGASGGAVDSDEAEDGVENNEDALDVETEDNSAVVLEEEDAGSAGGDAKQLSTARGGKPSTKGAAAATEDGSLMTTEEKATGSVPLSTYMRYIRSGGGIPVVVLILAVFTATEVLSVSSSVWLSVWSVKSYGLSQDTYLYVFLGCVAASIVCAPLRFYVAYNAMRLASLNLHQSVLFSVASAPMRFFDTTPLGRIVNRFSRDIDMCDNNLQMSFIFMLQTIFSAVSTTSVMLASQPFALIALVPCSVVYYRLMMFYNRANREVRRVASIVKSPMLALLSEVLTGHRTIRAYGKADVMLHEAQKRLDVIYAAGHMQNIANRWLATRIEFLANIIITTLALFAVLGKLLEFGSSNVGLISLGFTMALSITQVLNWIVRQVAAVEADMNSVERLVFYVDDIPHEDIPELTSKIHAYHRVLGPPTRSKATQFPEKEQEGFLAMHQSGPSLSRREEDQATTASDAVATPTSSSARGGPSSPPVVIAFQDVCMRYREGLPFVLHDLTFGIRQGDKVGIVGRSGGGKSSLLLTFLRIVECSSGTIDILGKSIRSYDLHDLRRLFAMIPQDPLLFDGTVRSNLDPFGECTDAELLTALDRVGMRKRVEEEPRGLEGVVLEQGSNFSVGQRQLLCLARALLRRGSQFILMDEATANIDPGLDRLIQTTIRTTLAAYTVITIAHRLHTVLEYNTILVMDKGRVVESGRPWDLAARENSTLRGMMASHGAHTEARLMKIVEKSKQRYMKQNAGLAAAKS